MGSYIHIGLCTRITFSKKDTVAIKKHFALLDDFKKVVETETHLAMQYFDHQEIDEAYIFTLKNELLEPDRLLSFLNEFLSYIHLGNESEFEYYCRELLDKVGQSKTAKDIIECAENRRDDSIRLYHFESTIHDVPNVPFFSVRDFQIDCIHLFHHGKAFLETYEPFFSYVERLIRVKHPQAHAQVIKLFVQ